MTALAIIWVAGATLAIIFGLAWVSIFDEPLLVKFGAGLVLVAAALTWPLVALAVGSFCWAEIRTALDTPTKEGEAR